jgi:hypothetical protein
MVKCRKILSDWEAPYIQSLIKLAETQSKTTLANWCIDYSEFRLLPIYESIYPGDLRPREALAAARGWLGGRIKLPQAKPVILECHAAAREADANPAAQAAARAIGQCASTIHSSSHCAGLALYGALAAAYDTAGIDTDWSELERFAAEECGRMEAALCAVSVEDEPNPAKMTWKC